MSECSTAVWVSLRRRRKQIERILKNNSMLLSLLAMSMGIMLVKVADGQPNFYAHALEPDKVVGATGVDNVKMAMNVSLEKFTFANVPERNATVSAVGVATRFKDEVRKNDSNLEQELYAMVGEAPIKEMVPFIAKQDRTVAAFIVAIAKKESNWGSASPSKGGDDCFNYWGYKGAGNRGVAMGYGCFESPQEGVERIGKRISELVAKDRTNPAKMVVWKCGSTCAGHDAGSVKKWISDVDLYFSKIVKES